MVRSYSFAWILVSLLSLTLAAPLQAAITPSGDIYPTNDPPEYWWSSGGSSGTFAYIGKTGVGSVTVNSGSDLSSYYGYIGYSSGSTGVVTVDGAGSTWINVGCLTVGRYGSGTLNITGGGVVTVEWETCVSHYSPSSGTIHFDNGTLTTCGLRCAIDDLTGTGTINTGALVSDVDLVFDATHGLNQTFNINDNPGQNITLNLTVDGSATMGAGYSGVGTMSISDGIVIESTGGHIGYKSGSTGEVTVDGSGSTWTNRYDRLVVGYFGSGTLDITGGGVSNFYGYIGSGSGSTGEVTVDGAGSTWTNGGNLVIGYYGSGTLNITGGGAVSSGVMILGANIGSASGSTGKVTVDGAGSTWTNSGDLYVGGTYTSAGGTGSVIVRNGGQVYVGEALKVWGTGTLHVGATGKVSIGEALLLKQDSTLTADAGATVHMTGSAFQNESTNSANLAGLSNLKLIFEGGTEDVDPFEVAGEDLGAVAGGWVDNFVLGTLTIGAGPGMEGRIQLVDNFDNQLDGPANEALYVGTLVIDIGAAIDLNGLSLYYLNGGGPKQLFHGDCNLDGNVDDFDLAMLLNSWGQSGKLWADGDYNGDTTVDDLDLAQLLNNWGSSSPLTGVPEPATLSLLAVSGVLALLRRRRSA